ncbi:hypothetical protein ACNAN0_02080 [Agrilactobacillus fermenti]|uniref:hypothetical protein n=1 Tax=Agrilactobacillus fermenti TaxID=2586909 RepID=UPI003A5BAB51
MRNVKSDFKNYVLQNTNPQKRTQMANLLENKFNAEMNGALTPSDVIDFMTQFYGLVKPEFRQSVDMILDANANIIEENHYLYEDASLETSLLAAS